MMFRKISVGIIVCLLLLVPIEKVYADNLVQGKTLIVYDAEDEYGSNVNILNSLITLALNSGVQVETRNLDNIKGINFKNYSKIIVLKCRNENLKNQVINDINSSNREIIYVANLEKSNIKYSKFLSIVDVLSMKKNTLEAIGNNAKGYKYLVIDGVSPFVNLNELVSKIEYLKNNGISFIISTIPIFENPNFNAMKRYTEVLRYAQSSGGYIILENPYVQYMSATSKEIYNPMINGFNNYLKDLVYPSAIAMNNNLIYKSGMGEFLDKTNTLFLRNINNNDVEDFDNFNSKGFKNLVIEVPYKNYLGGMYHNNQNLNIGVTIQNNVPLKEFKGDVSELIKKNIYFDNFGYINSEINVGNNKVYLNGGDTYLNNENVTQIKYISNKELFKDTNSNNTNQDAVSIELFLKIIIPVAIVVCIIFVILIVGSRKRDRRKYFR